MEGRRHGRAFWPDDPAGSRLFLGPTARVPGNGRGYFGVYELFVASFGVGLGDRGMISGGVSLIPGLSIGEQVYYIAPKIKVIDAELVEAAAGVLYVKPGTSEDDAGAAFAAVTVGNELGSFSGALSVPFGGRADFAEDPFLMLGGELRATRRLKFVSENWVVPGEEGALLSFGARILGERMSVEAAVITSTEGGFLPLVSFSLIW